VLQAIDIALNKYCGIELTAYALVVTRLDGQVATFFSDRVNAKHLFTAAFQNESLIASGHQPARKFQLSHTTFSVLIRNQARSPTRIIAIGDDAARDEVYRQCFKDMQQNGCKVLGKAWVKLLEPKKQSTYPYTKGASKRPPWWPAMTGPNKIRHKEPDHLHKRERIILLMHILGLIVNQDSTSVARQGGVDVTKLEQVTREAMATWFADREKPKNANKRGFLTQLFHVLYIEERYRRGELDGSTTVSINDFAGIVDHDNDNDDEDFDPSPQQHHQTQPISPFPSRPSSSLPPSHTIATTASAEIQHCYQPYFQRHSSSLPSPDTVEEYTDPAYPLYNYNSLSHQQAPTCPSRAWPAQELNIYGGSSWPTPTAAPLGPMQQFSFGMAASSPPQQDEFLPLPVSNEVKSNIMNLFLPILPLPPSQPS
jgi:hypothetical protein